jgi:hypothetical protein
MKIKQVQDSHNQHIVAVEQNGKSGRVIYDIEAA